jgi:hypothetical protein
MGTSPRGSWKEIGTDALQKIIERVYHQTERRKVQDLKRAFAGI